MKNISLDTDIFIDFLRGFDKAKQFFAGIQREEYVIYFSAITETELISGKECNKIERKAEILRLLDSFNKIAVTNEIAVKAGDFSRIYGVETADATIAATAFLAKADLITRNRSDFEKIKELIVKSPY